MKLEEFFRKVGANSKDPKTIEELAKLGEVQMGLMMAFAAAEGGGAQASVSAEASSEMEMEGEGKASVSASACASGEASISVDTAAIKKASEAAKKTGAWAMALELSEIILAEPEKSIPALLTEALEEKYPYTYKSEGYSTQGDALQILSWAALGEVAKKSDAAFPVLLKLVVPDGKLAGIAGNAIMVSVINTPKERRESLAKYAPEAEKKLNDKKIDDFAKGGLGIMVGLAKGMN